MPFLSIRKYFSLLSSYLLAFAKCPSLKGAVIYSHLSLLSTVLDCPVSGKSQSQEPSRSCSFTQKGDVFHLLQAGQWLHQPLKAVTHVSLSALCALLSLPANSGSMVLGCHGWKQQNLSSVLARALLASLVPHTAAAAAL